MRLTASLAGKVLNRYRSVLDDEANTILAALRNASVGVIEKGSKRLRIVTIGSEIDPDEISQWPCFLGLRKKNQSKEEKKKGEVLHLFFVWKK